MERLWAPWRLSYLTGSTPAERDRSCFLCLAAKIEEPQSFSAENLIVAASNDTFVILNRFPYSSGHLLVSPKRHIASLEELTPTESLDLMTHIQIGTRALRLAFQPDGFNVGINLGQIAGAGVPGHLHVHIVPRWNGDHNFMPVTGGTRVMPLLLEDAWSKIHASFTTNAAPPDLV